MNDHVPTHILREQEEFTKDQERHNVWLRRKLREMDAEERQASIEREKKNGN